MKVQITRIAPQVIEIEIETDDPVEAEKQARELAANLDFSGTAKSAEYIVEAM